MPDQALSPGSRSSTDRQLASSQPALDREAAPVIVESGESQFVRYVVGRLDGFEPKTKALEDLKRLTGARSVEFDAEGKRIVIMSELPIPNLRLTWDEIAFGWGSIPYMEELEARAGGETPSGDFKVAFGQHFVGDFPKDLVFEEVDSDRLRMTFRTWRYERADGAVIGQEIWDRRQLLLERGDGGYKLGVVNPIVDPEPENALRSILCHQGSPPGSIPFEIAPSIGGKLDTNRLTAHCMAHDRFVIRVWDASGKLLAIEKEELRGDSILTLIDLSGDGQDEIVIFRIDHGDPEVVVLSLTDP